MPNDSSLELEQIGDHLREATRASVSQLHEAIVGRRGRAVALLGLAQRKTMAFLPFVYGERATILITVQDQQGAVADAFCKIAARHVTPEQLERIRQDMRAVFPLGVWRTAEQNEEEAEPDPPAKDPAPPAAAEGAPATDADSNTSQEE